MKNILFIVVDCLRADRCWGKSRTCLTPALDQLVRNSTVFEQCISISSYTVSSFASILTGTYPFVHGLRGLGGRSKLSEDCRTLAEILADNGYHTYAEVTGPLLGMLGFDRGFHQYHHRNDSDTIYTAWGEDFIHRLESRGYKEPWFIFLHLWEIHDPPRIVLLEFDKKQFGLTQYDRAVSSLDCRLQCIFNALDDGTLLVLTGDHGEGISGHRTESILKIYHTFSRHFSSLTNTIITPRFKERIKTLLRVNYANQDTKDSKLGYEHPHGVTLFDYNHRVPLIFKGDVFERGRIFGQQVSHIDILPTLLSVLGIKIDTLPHHLGRDIFSLDSCNDVPVFLELAGDHIKKSEWLFGLRTPDYKYIIAPFNEAIEDQLFELNKARPEDTNVIEKYPEIAKRFQNLLDLMLGDLIQGSPRTQDLSSEERQEMENKLKSLGYL